MNLQIDLDSSAMVLMDYVITTGKLLLDTSPCYVPVYCYIDCFSGLWAIRVLIYINNSIFLLLASDNVTIDYPLRND